MPGRIKQGVQRVIGFVQKILITVLLIILYVVGFGITSLLFLRTGMLRNKYKSHKTFWREVSGYESDVENNIRQS